MSRDDNSGSTSILTYSVVDASGSNATFLGVSGLIGFGSYVRPKHSVQSIFLILLHSTVTVASSIEVDLEGAADVNSHPFLENVSNTTNPVEYRQQYRYRFSMHTLTRAIS